MAGEDPIRAYSASIEELNRAKAKVQQIQEIIASVLGALHKPFEFMVSNVDVGFPPEVAMTQVPTLNANDWPSAKQIAEAISNLHDKQRKAEHAYRSLSKADQQIVSPPPDKR